eukprot:g16858.t1
MQQCNTYPRTSSHTHRVAKTVSAQRVAHVAHIKLSSTNQRQGNIFNQIAAIFSHRPSLWTSSLASQAAKDKTVPAYNNTIASLRR